MSNEKVTTEVWRVTCRRPWEGNVVLPGAYFTKKEAEEAAEAFGCMGICVVTSHPEVVKGTAEIPYALAWAVHGEVEIQSLCNDAEERIAAYEEDASSEKLAKLQEATECFGSREALCRAVAEYTGSEWNSILSHWENIDYALDRVLFRPQMWKEEMESRKVGGTRIAADGISMPPNPDGAEPMEISVDTPLGRIVAEKGADLKYPGMFLVLERSGGTHMDLIGIEYPDDSGLLRGYVWEDPASEDPTQGFAWEKADIEKALDGGEPDGSDD